MQLAAPDLQSPSISLYREWLETDGLGGYAAMTLSGALTRRYHGLLCMPLRQLGERHVLISKLMASVELSNGERYDLDTNLFSRDGGFETAPKGLALLERFWIDEAPHWEYRCGETIVQVTILMPRGVHATLIEYKTYGTSSVGSNTDLNKQNCAKLLIRPLTAARNIHKTTRANSSLNEYPTWNDSDKKLTFKPYIGYPGFEIIAPSTSRWRAQPEWWRNFLFPRDAERGFDFIEDLHSPGEFCVTLNSNESIIFGCFGPNHLPSTTLIEMFNAEVLRRRSRYGGLGTLPILRRASEQFLTTDPMGQPGIVAGYPWFDRWGRDTLISIGPLSRVLGDSTFERNTLEHQLNLLNDGLVPNLISENGTALYNSIDAVLWLFVAVYRYFMRTQDSSWIAKVALPKLRDTAEILQRGTRFGIFVGSDGLLCAGTGDSQLTWMDAKVNGHPVTPRHGKAVEINALWFSALRILSALETSSSAQLAASSLASLTQRSFKDTFIKTDGTLRDTVGSGFLHSGNELRPNQIFAGSLPFPIIETDKIRVMLDVVRAELVTPRGLRTLSPAHKDYRARYEGSSFERDSAYHQGTAWPWLMGPYAEALLRCGETQEIEQLKDALIKMLNEGCIGSIAEVYDAEAPQNAGGCFAQAWSVAAACSIVGLT